MRTKFLVVLTVLGLAAPAALATSYASGITDMGGGMYSFILNQDAGNVVINRYGDTPLNLGALPMGEHTFNLGAGTGFDISVGSVQAPGWAQISVDGTPTSFYSPRGISINKNPGSPLFGRVYVSNSVPGTTAFGRTVDDGIYTLRADMTDLGFESGGVAWGGTNGPWKSFVGADDHVYVVNYTEDTLHEFGIQPDGSLSSTPTQVIGPEDRWAGQYVAAVWVDGTQAGGDRVIYTVNSHYLDPAVGVQKYNLGGLAEADGPGTQFIAPDPYVFYPYDVVRDSNNDWYTSQYRWYTGQAPAVRKFDGSGTEPLGDDPLEILWESTDTVSGGYNLDIFDQLGWVAYAASGAGQSGEVYIFDQATGALIGQFNTGMVYGRDLAFDAAGNIYVGDNSAEWMRVFSPGGNWLAVTGSDGTFTLIPEPASLMLLALAGVALLRRR